MSPNVSCSSNEQPLCRRNLCAQTRNARTFRKEEHPTLIYHLASKTILCTATTRRTNAKRQSHTPIVESIPPRIRIPEKMPTADSLPISLRVPCPGLRRRRSKRPTCRPTRLRHPYRFRVRNRSYAGCEIAERRRRPAGVKRIHVRANPVDFSNHGLPVAILPNIGRVHVPEWPIHARSTHSAARLTDVTEDIRRACTLAIEVFAAD